MKGRRQLRHGPWSTFRPLSPECSQHDSSRHIFPGAFWSGGQTNIVGISIRRSGSTFRAFRISQLRVLSRNIKLWTRKNPIPAACTWDSSFSVITQDSWPYMRIWKKIALKTLRYLKAPFCDHRAIKFTYNCFPPNPSVNLLVLPPVTREYHSKVLEHIDLLSCIAVYLQRALVWVSG